MTTPTPHRRRPTGLRVRRALVVVATLALLTTSLLGCSETDPAKNASDRSVVVSIDVAHPGLLLPADFLGLSFEASVLGSDLFDPARSDLSALMRDLGTGRLRFGGNSVDRVAAWTADPTDPLPSWAHSRVTPADLVRVGVLAGATGWKVDLGLDLGHADSAAAADEARTAVHLIGDGLGTIQYGNEPDLLGDVRAAYGEGAYRAELAAYRASIATVAPGVPISGPDTARISSLSSYGAADGAGLALLTQHLYPLTRCGGGRPTIDQLLSVSTVSAEARVAGTAAAVGRAMGLPVRLDETNSASCGGQDGVSNTLASAFWMVEYLATVAQRGVDGVGVQGGLAACRGYTPLCVPGAEGAAPRTAPGIDSVADASLGAADSDGRLAAQPDFYGLLVVHELEGGKWLPSTGNRPMATWEAAVKMPDGAVRVVIVNPSPDAAANITVRALGHSGPAKVQWLTGPSLGATSGVRLGGAEVGADGGWEPMADAALPSNVDGLHVRVPAATAALVTLPADQTGARA